MTLRSGREPEPRTTTRGPWRVASALSEGCASEGSNTAGVFPRNARGRATDAKLPFKSRRFRSEVHHFETETDTTILVIGFEREFCDQIDLIGSFNLPQTSTKITSML